MGRLLVSLSRVQSAASEFRMLRLAVVGGSRVQSAVPESRILGLVLGMLERGQSRVPRERPEYQTRAEYPY